MNGSIAIGSRRTTPTLPTAAAVVSEDSVAPRNTPCSQDSDSATNGTVVLRRPPKMMAEIGTPTGESYSGASTSHWVIGVQNRELGCAAGWPADGSSLPSASKPPGVQARPCQSVSDGGVSAVIPSHQTPPSGVAAT